MNASFTISRHDDSYNEALDVESHMNRSFTVSREQTMEDRSYEQFEELVE